MCSGLVSANQLTTGPESTATIQRSGKRGDSSQKSCCGLMGSASIKARVSNTCHHSCVYRALPRDVYSLVEQFLCQDPCYAGRRLIMDGTLAGVWKPVRQ